MTVYELSREQLNELKENYFWSDDYIPCCYKHWNTGDYVPVLFPHDIPDDIIFNIYDGITFVNDDFCCSMGK